MDQARGRKAFSLSYLLYLSAVEKKIDDLDFLFLRRKLTICTELRLGSATTCYLSYAISG